MISEGGPFSKALPLLRYATVYHIIFEFDRKNSAEINSYHSRNTRYLFLFLHK